MDEDETPKTPASTPVYTRVTSRASARKSANVLVDDVVDLLSKALISPSSSMIPCGSESVKAPTYDSLMSAVRDRLLQDKSACTPGQQAAHGLISLGRSTSVLSPTTRQLYLEAVFSSFDPVEDLPDVISTVSSVADVRLKLAICCACVQFRGHSSINLLIQTNWLLDTAMMDAAFSDTVLGSLITGPLGLSFFASKDTPDEMADAFLQRLKELIQTWVYDQIVPDPQLSPESRAVRRRIIYQIEHWACDAKMIMAWADFAVFTAWTRQDTRLRHGIRPIVPAYNTDGCVAQLMRIRSTLDALLSEISAIKDWKAERDNYAAIFLWLPAEYGTILFGRQCTYDAIKSVREGTAMSRLACIFDLERELDSAVQVADSKLPKVCKTSADPQRMNVIANSNVCFDVGYLDETTEALAKRVQMSLNSNNVYLHTVMQEVSQHNTAIVAGVARFSNVSA